MYIPAPDDLPGFPGAVRTKPKGGRSRWMDRAGHRIYEWDKQHGTLEVYNDRGEHLGEYNHESGTRIKGAVPGRRISP